MNWEPLDRRVGSTLPMHRLEVDPLHRFRDWPHPDVPANAPGVYSVWFDGRLLYIGVAGIRLGPPPRLDEWRTGVRGRLAAIVDGQRPNTFLRLLADRLVLRALTAAQVRDVAHGETTVMELTRAFVREYLTYRVVITNDGTEARRLARRAREGLPVAGPPLFNPRLSARDP